MGEEKKMSLFMPEAVVRAAKAQAAGTGTGVSDMMKRVFLCAHCGEPITDEFIIGVPATVSPTRFSVFYHKHREACMIASGGERHSFMVPCPKCNQHAHQTFVRLKLFHALRNNDSVRFYCIRCDHMWDATQAQTKQLISDLQPK